MGEDPISWLKALEHVNADIAKNLEDTKLMKTRIQSVKRRLVILKAVAAQKHLEAKEQETGEVWSDVQKKDDEDKEEDATAG